MATTLEELTGGPPKAPRPPDVEDVLGPPPHAPHIGGRSGGLHLAGRLRSPARPPHLARPTPPPQARPQPAPSQAPAPRVVIQQAAPNPVTPDKAPPPTPDYSAKAGLQKQRDTRTAEQKARRQARLQAAKLNTSHLRRQPPAEGSSEGEGMSPEVRAKRAAQYAEMKGTLDALRRPASASEGEAHP